MRRMMDGLERGSQFSRNSDGIRSGVRGFGQVKFRIRCDEAKASLCRGRFLVQLQALLTSYRLQRRAAHDLFESQEAGRWRQVPSRSTEAGVAHGACQRMWFSENRQFINIILNLPKKKKKKRKRKRKKRKKEKKERKNSLVPFVTLLSSCVLSLEKTVQSQKMSSTP